MTNRGTNRAICEPTSKYLEFNTRPLSMFRISSRRMTAHQLKATYYLWQQLICSSFFVASDTDTMGPAADAMPQYTPLKRSTTLL